MISDGRRIIKVVSSSLAEIVVVELQPGYESHRSTCPDGQFWLPVRGRQVVDGTRRQRPFDLLYYAPRQPAVRLTDTPTISYGLRVRLSKMEPQERDQCWIDSSDRRWDTKRQVLKLLNMGLTKQADPHLLDEAIAQWVSTKRTQAETSSAQWLHRIEELLRDDPSLSLPELSQSVGIVPAYLSGEFSRLKGFTISALRRQVMLERALRTAETSNLNVSAIEAGFYDASHFHRACVAELDVKPSHLRRLIWPT